MAGMMFMKLTGIDGEEPIGSSPAQKMIAIAGYSHRVSTPIAQIRPNSGEDIRNRRGPCDHGLFVVQKGFDKTSPKLFSASCNGVIFDNAVIYVCSQDRNSLTNSSKIAPFFTITMTEAIIANFSYESSGTWPMEVMSLHYTSISWKVDWIDPDEENDTASKSKLEPVGWDGELDKESPTDVPSALSWKSSLL
ncbi:type VI secretion system tube protein Hcp [Rubinisphaera sp.]|uniref:Hcp family type VI secretion system effector n=1 Tax=Rubinisphaera sp. TaxID=2024857 RepID=UPI0025CF1D6E|nr:type VI secretion system tube protein Hcp [Rubinisphaera sp.]